MMILDRLTLGRTAKELGFVRDTLEKVCRLVDVLKFFESDDLLANALALKGGTAINLTIFDLICLVLSFAYCADALLLNELVCHIPFLRWCVLGIKRYNRE